MHKKLKQARSLLDKGHQEREIASIESVFFLAPLPSRLPVNYHSAHDPPVICNVGKEAITIEIYHKRTSLLSRGWVALSFGHRVRPFMHCCPPSIVPPRSLLLTEPGSSIPKCCCRPQTIFFRVCGREKKTFLPVCVGGGRHFCH